MLSATKLRQLCADNNVSATALAGHLARGSFDEAKACSAVKNWQRGLFRPQPEAEDIRRLASALNVERNELVDWESTYRFAPMSARKVRLVTQLIAGLDVQDALDTLAFTNKRAASMVTKVLKAAVADADEQQADVDKLYVCEARVDEAGIRIGTKRWIAKDRGRAHPIRKKACHIHISVTEA